MSFLSKLSYLFEPLAQGTPDYKTYMSFASDGATPSPRTMNKNYRSYAKEGYRGDSTVYKCVSYIARNGAAIRPKLYTDHTMETEIEQHPLLDLLNTPNPTQTGVAFREACISFLLISGNAYQYANATTKGAAPQELWTLRPDNMQIVANASNIVDSYQYKPNGLSSSATVQYDPATIGHLKYFSPDDELYGMSPLEVAAIMVDQQTAAKKWNLALLQNWCRLPGAWIVPTPLGKNERERLEAKLKEKLQGYKNAGSPPVLDGGLTWQSIGVAPGEMDWLEGLQWNAGAIANIYAIPPQIIGDTSATTFDNMKQAEVYSYTEGIFPDLDRVYALWNGWLVPKYPDLKKKAYLYYDKESVEVIQEVIQEQRTAQSKRATSMWMSGTCTLNEARDLQGLKKIPVNGEVFRIGGILIPTNKLADYAKQSLTAPAIPPLPVHEQSLTPPPTQGGATIKNPGGTQTGNPQAPVGIPSPETPRLPPTPNKPKNPKKVHQEAMTLYIHAKVEQFKQWIPDEENLRDELEGWHADGVQQLQWQCQPNSCELCLMNDGEIVPVGTAFTNGYYLPICHPNCYCTVNPIWVSGSMTAALLPFTKFNEVHDPHSGQFGAGHASYPQGGSVDEKEKFLVTHGGNAWENSLSTKQKDSIADYADNSYEAMNNALRTGNYQQPAQIWDRSSAQLKTQITECQAGLLAGKAPANLVVIRGYGNSQLEAFKTAASTGGVFHEKGFVSTTIQESLGSHFTNGFVVHIHIPKDAPGGYVSPFSYRPDEREWLLPHSSTFKVANSAVDAAGKWTFHVFYAGVQEGVKDGTKVAVA